MHNSAQGRAGGVGPTVVWRESSPQNSVNGSFTSHPKGACCVVPEYNPDFQWAKDAEDELSEYKTSIPVLRTWHATAKLHGEGAKAACPPASNWTSKKCPDCNKYSFPEGFALSDPAARRDFVLPEGEKPCYNMDGTHYLAGGPAYYHWIRVAMHHMRSMPPVNTTRDVARVFEAFERSMGRCDLEEYGYYSNGDLVRRTAAP